MRADMPALVRIAFYSDVYLHTDLPYANVCSHSHYNIFLSIVNAANIGYTVNMKRIPIILLVLLLLFGCTYDPTESEDTQKLDIYAFSIGKADALLLRTSDAAIMIDTGEHDDGDKLVAKLKELGVEKLDLMVLTHFDKDHIGGADTIIEALSIDRIVLPGYEKDSKQYAQLLAALAQAASEISYLSQDLALTYGELELTIWVSPVPFDGKSDNEQSLITKVLYQGKSYLFMGDAEGKELEKLVFGTRNLTCDVLKLPHHGVYDANTLALITTSMPSHVIICDSEKNPADAETIQAMALIDPIILQTKNGDVHLTISEGVIKVDG